MIKHFVLKFRFIQKLCPYNYHWCNGKVIPDIDLKTGKDKSGFTDLPPCKHFIKGRCCHPERNKIIK